MRGVLEVDGSPIGDAHTFQHLERPGRPGRKPLTWHGHPIVAAGDRFFVPWHHDPEEQGEEKRARAGGSTPGRQATRPASVAGPPAT